MKTLLACFLLCITVLTQAQQAVTFKQQRAASGQAVVQKYPEAKQAGSHLSRCADKVYLQWQATQDWRLNSPDFPMFLWDCAEIQRQLEVRLAQIRATSYATPAPAPVTTYRPRPTAKPSAGATVITGSGGVYTTHGGAAGGATIIHQGAGHYMIRAKDGTTQQVIVTPP